MDPETPGTPPTRVVDGDLLCLFPEGASLDTGYLPSLSRPLSVSPTHGYRVGKEAACEGDPGVRVGSRPDVSFAPTPPTSVVSVTTTAWAGGPGHESPIGSSTSDRPSPAHTLHGTDASQVAPPRQVGPEGSFGIGVSGPFSWNSRGKVREDPVLGSLGSGSPSFPPPRGPQWHTWSPALPGPVSRVETWPLRPCRS